MTNIKEPYRNPRNIDIEEKKMIKCPACKAEAWNDPNNQHLEARGMVGSKTFAFHDIRTRQFANTYFCTKCTRATRVD